MRGLPRVTRHHDAPCLMTPAFTTRFAAPGLRYRARFLADVASFYASAKAAAHERLHFSTGSQGGTCGRQGHYRAATRIHENAQYVASQGRDIGRLFPFRDARDRTRAATFSSATRLGQSSRRSCCWRQAFHQGAPQRSRHYTAAPPSRCRR